MQKIVFSFLAALPACLASGMDGQITAYRDENVLLVRSFFSETKDIVLKIEAHSSSLMPNEKAGFSAKIPSVLYYMKL